MSLTFSAVGVGAVSYVFGGDAARRRAKRRRMHVPLPVAAVLDETAHLITAALPLGRLRRAPATTFLVGAALGATLIDLDHLPGLLGWRVLERTTYRPLLHSLPVVAVAALGATCTAGARRQLAHGDAAVLGVRGDPWYHRCRA